MPITSAALGTNPSAPGLTDGSITVYHVWHVPSNPGDVFYYSKDYGSSFQYGGTIPYKVYSGLGAGSYFCLMRINLGGTDEFSVPTEVILTDGTPEPPDPDSIVYKDFYKGDFCDKEGDDIFVTLKHKELAGDPDPDVTAIMFAGEQPVKISHKEPDNFYKQEPINGTECTVKIHAPKDGSFQLSDIYTTDEREWMLVISGKWNWSGFVIPDSCQEPFMPLPYDVEISATDGLGALKDQPFVTELIGTGLVGEVTVLKRALDQTGLKLNIVTAVNTIEASMDMSGTDTSPLKRSFINLQAFLKPDRTFISAHEVLRSIVEKWSCRLRQWDGEWQLVNTLEKSAGDIDGARFDPDANFIEAVTIGNEITCGSTSDYDIAPVNGTLSIAKAFKSSTGYYKYGYLSNELYNGNMDIWLTNPTGLPDGWTEEGAITAETGIRMVGSIATTDYYIIIHNETANGYILNNNPVQIRANAPVTVSFDFYAPSAYYIFGDRYIQVVLINDDGEYYDNNGWHATYVTYDVKYNATYMKGQFNLTFEIPARAADWQLTFGLRNMDSQTATRYELNVNNVRITSGINDAAIKPGIGLINKQIQEASQTYTKDDIVILHGDEPLDTQKTSNSVIDDGGAFVAPVSWSRAGYTEDKNILQIVTNSELVNHQRPYRILEAEFINAYKDDLNPNTLLTVDLITGSKFIFLSGDFYLKEGNHQLTFAEALTSAKTPDVEELKEDYGD